jgi:phage-related holin
MHDRSNTHHRFKFSYKMKYVHKKIHVLLSPIFHTQLLEMGTISYSLIFFTMTGQINIIINMKKLGLSLFNNNTAGQPFTAEQNFHVIAQ